LQTQHFFGVRKRCQQSHNLLVVNQAWLDIPLHTVHNSVPLPAFLLYLSAAVFMQCLSCDCCGLGPVCSILLAAFNCIWWLASAAVLTAATAVADASGMRAAGPRHALIAAAWTAAVVELVHSILACVAVGNNVCNILLCVPAAHTDEECCAGCEECCGDCCCSCCRPQRRHHVVPHHQQPLLPGTAAAAAAAAATTAALSKRAWWGVMRPQQQQQQQQQRLPGACPHAGQPPAAAGCMVSAVGPVPSAFCSHCPAP
jgi:hypothetical protein